MKSTEEFDRLAARDELQKSGFSLDQANTIVHVIGNAVTTNVASNNELRFMSKELAHRFTVQHSALQTALRALHDEMRRGFEAAGADRQKIRDEMQKGFEVASADHQKIRDAMQR